MEWTIDDQVWKDLDEMDEIECEYCKTKSERSQYEEVK